MIKKKEKGNKLVISKLATESPSERAILKSNRKLYIYIILFYSLSSGSEVNNSFISDGIEEHKSSRNGAKRRILSNISTTTSRILKREIIKVQTHNSYSIFHSFLMINLERKC